MSYHNKVMNIQLDVEGLVRESRILYKSGHRDARHDAAEIAMQADKDIEDLVKSVYELREALFCSDNNLISNHSAIINSTELLQRLCK